MIVAAAVALVGSLLGDPEVWISRALVVLVAAAPCAFAISVPVTVVAAIGAASRIGALVKGGAALEALDGIRVVALDKTGTLTRNRPQVIAVDSTAELLRPTCCRSLPHWKRAATTRSQPPSFPPHPIHPKPTRWRQLSAAAWSARSAAHACASVDPDSSTRPAARHGRESPGRRGDGRPRRTIG